MIPDCVRTPRARAHFEETLTMNDSIDSNDLDSSSSSILNSSSNIKLVTLFDVAGHLSELVCIAAFFCVTSNVNHLNCRFFCIQQERIEYWLQWQFDEACSAIASSTHPLVVQVWLPTFADYTRSHRCRSCTLL